MFRFLPLLVVFLSFSAAQSTLSVLHFDNLKKEKQYDWLTIAITDILTVELSDIPDIQMVERAALSKIMDELNFGETDLVDEKTAQKAGKVLGAKFLMSGSFLVGKKLTITSRIIESETGKIFCPVKETGKIKEVDDLLHRVAEKVAGHFGSKGVTPVKFSFKEMETYARGLKAMDEEKFDAAQSVFRNILKQNPGFMPAASNLSLCFKRLKKFKQMRYQREINKLLRKIKNTGKFIRNQGYEQDLAKWITAFNRKFPSPTPRQKKFYDALLIIRANTTTPGHGIWHIMMDLNEVGDKHLEYFQDTTSYKSYRFKAIQTGLDALEKYPSDKFLNEIYYTIILGYHLMNIMFKEPSYHGDVKRHAEIFMERWPDYRLIEFVEDAYEDALKKLSD